MSRSRQLIFLGLASILAFAACGGNAENGRFVSGAAAPPASGGDEGGTDGAAMDGTEPLSRPIVLPDSAERMLRGDLAPGTEAYLFQDDRGLLCLGIRYPAGEIGTMCGEPEQFNSYASLYSEDGEGKHRYVIGVTAPEVEELTFSFGSETVTMKTQMLEDVPQARFFLSPIPRELPTDVVGRSGGREVLRPTRK